MMAEELGLSVSESSPAINGLVTFISFVLFGFPPLIPYIITQATNSPKGDLLIGSLATGGFFLFALGFTKAILLGTGKMLSGTLTLLLGAGAVAVGYGIGVGLRI
jgi:VIT1/CCC1 family predicted Fe2+/Mn2+ transporter